MNSRTTLNQTSKVALNNSTNYMQGGASMNEYDKNVKDERYYRHKARKYHFKTQQKLKQMMNNGLSVPPGYEQYLQPFSG